jgi:PAS domain S-box-containing protein
MEMLLDGVPGAVWGFWDADASGAWRTQFISAYITKLSGYSREQWLADPNLWASIVHPDDKPIADAAMQSLFAMGEVTSQVRWVRPDGSITWVESLIRVVKNEAGAVIGLSGVTMDITARKQAEEAQARLREQILAELSTPLIPIKQDVVAMPLIGTLDRARASRVVEALLRGVSAARARVAILDVTGVSNVDVEVADALVRAAKGARLLGAQVVLTGIRPEVAQTLVTLGTDLQGVLTLSTLEAGIRFAMQRG